MENKKVDATALFNIGYGLYVLTSKKGEKENGCIINTVTQLTSSPITVAVTVNKANYSHDLIKETKTYIKSNNSTTKIFNRYLYSLIPFILLIIIYNLTKGSNTVIISLLKSIIISLR